jgi:hypothetical protein
LSEPIDQDTRRIISGEMVPAGEKLVSLFEAHAGVLVKDRRETYYVVRRYFSRRVVLASSSIARSRRGIPAMSRGLCPSCVARNASSDGLRDR